MTFDVRALDGSLLTAWRALFDASEVPCHCRYWHFTGTKNDWLARCAFEADASAEEQAALVRAGEPAARGLVAMADGETGARVVGWLKLAPRASLPKLRALPAYRAFHDEGTYAVGCLLVDPGFRRRGVARALIAAADEHVRAWGGRAICAFPRRAAEPIHDAEAWMGPLATFLAHGYVEVAGEGPYPVLRKELTPAPRAAAPSAPSGGAGTTDR